MKKTLLFIASITLLLASSTNLESEELTSFDVLDLICNKPLIDECNCEDVKFFNSKKGKFIHTGDKMRVGDVIEGNFVEKNEAIANLFGCQSHSDSWGGYVLLRKNKKNKWKVIKYKTPYLGDCEKVHLKNGKDILLCKSNFVQHGIRTNTLSVLGADNFIYQGDDNAGAVEENSPKYYNKTIKSYKIVYEGKDIYIVLTVYNKDAKHKNRTKVIKKKLNLLKI